MPMPAKAVLLVHGGAGVINRDSMSSEMETRYTTKLGDALIAGHKVLKAGGSSLDAVVAAIQVLEDSPLFNAGKGSVFTHEGRNELDAAVMEGKTKRAGAVAGVTIVKNPISAARAVMEQSPHVLLIGRGAEVFATKAGLEIVDPAYFWTEARWEQIREVWRREAEGKQPAEKSGTEKSRPEKTPAPSRKPDRSETPSGAEDHPYGTVGAVALDQHGNLAAGTSTGGIHNKMFGRVGDSPIIGAGTYADNESCAISATGQGEFFIRLALAHEITALMKYKQLPVEKAAAEVVLGKLKTAGGEGGLIALDAQGNFTAPYNTAGMFRGYITRDGRTHVMLNDD